MSIKIQLIIIFIGLISTDISIMKMKIKKTTNKRPKKNCVPGRLHKISRKENLKILKFEKNDCVLSGNMIDLPYLFFYF